MLEAKQKVNIWDFNMETSDQIHRATQLLLSRFDSVVIMLGFIYFFHLLHTIHKVKVCLNAALNHNKK